MPTWRAAVTAARPLVQKWACATSGVQSPSRQCFSSQRANSPMYGRSRSGGDRVRRPAGTCTTRMPLAHGDHLGGRRILAAGVDADLVAELGQGGRQVGDMGAAGRRHPGAGVLGDHRDAHVVPPGRGAVRGAPCPTRQVRKHHRIVTRPPAGYEGPWLPCSVPSAPLSNSVFAVLADGWSYSDWVVGTVHMRDVDAELAASRVPTAPQGRTLADVAAGHSTVVALTPERRLKLNAGLWPLG